VCVVCVGVWGWFPLAFEHSKVCTLCDFGHLQFYDIQFTNTGNSVIKKQTTK
jgi:hypothetical protein